MAEKSIAIIGAGPAGIYTALLLANFKGAITLFEQNKDVGEKLKTTGGGRMNVTNKVFGPDQFTSHQDRTVARLFKNPHFEHRTTILEKLGIEHQYEKNRAILKSQDAIAEVARLKAKLLEQKNLDLKLNTKIVQIKSNDNNFEINNQLFSHVILTTGGMYRMKDLGEPDKIYSLPHALGHTTTTVRPSLCPLIFKDENLRQLSGISFVGELIDTQNKRTITDDLLITHFGISGPGSLDFSSFAGDQCQLRFLSQLEESEFVKQFNQARNGKQSIKKFLKPHLAQRLVDFHLKEADITQDFIADVPKLNLTKLTQSLFHYPIGKRQPNTYPASWTTKGGVSMNEIKTKNLESKITNNLYFAGEVIDFDGLCGGYNISFAAISAQIVADDLICKSTS